ncbi:MAG: DsbA family protein [Hyphomonadaceae bacterium]
MTRNLVATLVACAAVALSLAGASCSRQSEQAQAPAAAPAPPITQSIDVSQFNEAQQADIRAIVRDYLVRDPAVLEAALEALAAQKADERRREFENDTRSYSHGPANAAVTIVELYDYRCPYCHAALEWVNRVIATRRDVRVVFREHPILTQQSHEAALAAMAVLQQNRQRFLPFHRALMAFRGDLTSAQIDTLARNAGVDVARMRRDMGNPEIEEQFRRTMELASESGMTGTPAFVINGRVVNGYPGPEELDRVLREATEAARTQQTSN